MNLGILSKIVLITLLTTGVILSVHYYGQPRRGKKKKMDKLTLDSDESVQQLVQKCRDLLQQLDIHRVVIWGYKESDYKEANHTHSYIHKAWYDAFQFLGIDDLYWEHAVEYTRASNYPIQYKGPTKDTLFITEGYVCDDIPWKPDGYYVLHNIDGQRTPIPDDIPLERILHQQFYSDASVDKSFPLLDTYHRLNYDLKNCHMPWATNMNPYECMEPSVPQKGGVVIIGQHGDIYSSKIKLFLSGMKEDIRFTHLINMPHEKSVALIRDSTLAPSIVNQWQKDHGYIPCRIFKNTSYGTVPVTTSLSAHRILHGMTIYDEDEKQLGAKAEKMLKHYQKEKEAHHLAWHLTKTRHTYLNRIYFLLQCFMLKKKAKESVCPLFHLTYSQSLVSHMDWVAQQCRTRIEHWDMRSKENMHKDAIISQEVADSWWKTYESQLRNKPLIVISGSPLLSRMFWDNMQTFTGKIILWLHKATDVEWDKETQQMWKAWTQIYSDRVKVIHGCKAYRVQNVLNHLMVNSPWSDHVLHPLGRKTSPPLQHSSIPDYIVQDQTHYLYSPTGNLLSELSDGNTVPIPTTRLQELGVQWYQGRFNGLNDLKDFAAILWIPHQLSYNVVYETWSMNKVWYIPSWPFFKSMHKGLNEKVWQESLWYTHEHRYLFVFFDSWEDLQQKWYANAHKVKEHLIADYRNMIERQNIEQWNTLLTLW